MKISPKCQTWDKWLFVVRLFDNKKSMDKNILTCKIEIIWQLG